MLFILQPSLTTNSRLVTHDVPVHVIPGRQWHEFDEPEVPDFDVSHVVDLNMSHVIGFLNIITVKQKGFKYYLDLIYSLDFFNQCKAFL